MFEFMRNYKKWFLLILLIFIIPSFILASFYTFSENKYDKYTKQDLVVIGKHAISLDDFRNTYIKVIKKIESEIGDQFDYKKLDTINMRIKVLHDMIREKLLHIVATDNNFKVSEDFVRNAIKAIDWGQGNNNFSFDHYANFLSTRGIDPYVFENFYRNKLSAEQILNNITISSHFPESLANLYAKSFFQKRFIKIIDYQSKMFNDKNSFTDEEIKDWYYKYNSKLILPENIDLEYIELNFDSIIKNLVINNDELLSFYKKNKINFITPEKRKFNYIKIFLNHNISQLEKSNILKNFIDIKANINTKTYSIDNLKKDLMLIKGINKIDLFLDNYLTEEEFINKFNINIKNDIFKMKHNEISNIIDFQNDFYIFEIKNIENANVLSFDLVKDKIQQKLRLEKANLIFYEKYNMLSQKISKNIDLKEIAKNLNLKYEKLNIKKNVTVDNHSIFNNSKIISELFKPEFLKNKSNSDIIKLSNQNFIACKVIKHNLSYLPTLEEAKFNIQSILDNEISIKNAISYGQNELKLLKNGDRRLENLKFSEIIEISRNSNCYNLSDKLIDYVMKIPLNEIPGYFGLPYDNGFFLIYIEKVEDINDFALTQEFNTFLSNSYGDCEAYSIFHELCDQYKVKILDSTKNLLELQTF
ncbi:Peptidyl-prolyl cis-trans isomerase D [Candidatus Kinetoplastibacterium sorsogonicusi]|uniref:Peptidyl-prolyl cis-trans isomerase D n=1 Tax=Candidatus Kinetoplastidibacterium kentomonadis TaxID=1576550 RepID=A0A3Q8EWW4_9PROT|nr:SurA N-terminal domain-containing protein [Candidatus Kinetoplastibacterium sorsogonicusi]AWD32378.1 Peptidyl-prolyl cis-trans isomerase D [Candidatus Kinetoplastibacterium sorsogonicusi]